MNACALPAGFDPTKAKQTLNRWIAHETARATREVTEAIEAYRFNDAAGAIYRFVWNVYCDWYLELAKPVLMGEEGAAKSRDPRHGGVGARRDPQTAASVHALHHRRAVGGDGQARRPAGAGAVVAQGRRADAGATGADVDHQPERSVDAAGSAGVRCRRFQRSCRRGRDRLGGRSRHRDPLGARGDEYSAGDADAAGAGRRVGRDQGTRAALERRDQADGPARRYFLRRSRAGRRGAAVGARRGRGACR